VAYLNCPECGLSVALLFPCAPIEHCPRCLARRRRAVELYVSAKPRKRDDAGESKPVEPKPPVTADRQVAIG
jgi:hypothetical protein